MRILFTLMVACVLSGCVLPPGNRWPIDEQVDPVTEEPPDVVTSR